MIAEQEIAVRDDERALGRLAAGVVLATRALAEAERARVDTTLAAIIVESRVVSLVEEVYAAEFDADREEMDGCLLSPDESTIHALAAAFIASLVLNPADAVSMRLLRSSVLLGCPFDALSDALGAAGYLAR